MRVYKFVSKRYGLLALRERRLKISRVTELNDAFEFLPFALPSPGERLAVNMTMSEMNDIAGVMCFSKTWANPVMWAHYADQHKGLCLGFHVPDKFRKKIRYVSKRQRFPNFEGKSLRAKLKEVDRLLFTKFKDWRYENEIRISVKLDRETEEKGMYFKNWDNDFKLTDVIVGVRSVTCKREIERELVGYQEPVKLVKAAASLTRFEVVEDEDGLRNHEDASCAIRRGDTIHPVEFVRDEMPSAKV